MAELRFLLALVATNLKSSFALRGAFWLQAIFMVANNALYFVFWWIFFARFEEVRGWGVEDMSALYGIVAFGFGAAVVFAGGVRELSRRVSNGDLDGYLTLPKNPLLHLVASRTAASGWGDMAERRDLHRGIGHGDLAELAAGGGRGRRERGHLRRHRRDPAQPGLLARPHRDGRAAGRGTS